MPTLRIDDGVKQILDRYGSWDAIPEETLERLMHMHEDDGSVTVIECTPDGHIIFHDRGFRGELSDAEFEHVHRLLEEADWRLGIRLAAGIGA
jgi:hypothetical protein